MTCQEAALQLPWWLNGSLEPAERREVKDHLASCASCREALAETRLAWEIYAQHIPTAALVAYAEDDRPEGGDQTDQIDPALLERHLADCPQCAAELEMVRASRLLVEHDDVLVLGDRFRGRQAAPPERGRERGWRTAALAACLTGLVAIGGWVGTVQQLHRVEKDAEPQVPRGTQGPAAAGSAIAFNSPFAEISATVTRDAKAPAPPTFQAGSGHARLLLNPRPTDTYREHAAEVLDSGGKVIAASDHLELKTGHSYSVDIDTDRLPAGAYTVQVYGTDGAARKPLDSFPFKIK